MPKLEKPNGCEERQRRLDAERAARLRLDRASAFSNCGLPSKHRRPVESRSPQWSAKLDALTPRLGTGFLVALLGPRGTGKTQLAAELIRKHVDSSNMPTPLYTRSCDIFLTIRESFRRDGPSEREQVVRFMRPSVLVIDEAHERSESDWENRLLNLIVDVRYGEERDTILISNERESSFRESIGPSIYSRLIETGGVIVCDWPSFRGT